MVDKQRKILYNQSQKNLHPRKGEYIMKLSHLFDSLRIIYNIKDDGGRGRTCMLISGILSGLVGQLSGGLFYTSFLLQYGLDKSRIGILTFVPYLTCLLNLLSPWLLEHFKKRKFILAAGKLLYYSVNIVAITLLPSLVKDETARLVCFVILTILASSINQLFASGYSAWNANFLPDHVRVDYFNTSGCINSAITFAITLGVSFLGDMLTGTEHELLMLTLIRYIAFGLAIIDCLIWLIPKEYPYATSVRAKLSNVFTLPLKNKRFIGTILIVALYNFVSNLPNATLNAYILEDVGISYTLCNGINAVYFLFFIFFSAMWKKFISKFYWFRAAGLAMLMQSITYFAYAFVTSKTVWLYVIIRLAQHIFGVAFSTIISSLPYVNLPEEDRTCYLSFHVILSNLFVFLSMVLGTGFTAFMEDTKLAFIGFSFSSTQILLFVCAVGQILVGIYSFAKHKKLTPPDLLTMPHT